MGEVYRARDSRLGRDVAVKVLPRRLSADAQLRARFEREARTISSLNHPHICVLHDVGREDGTDFLVMELVDGETLANRIERGAIPLSEALSIGRQLARALDFAHRAGVVHRDLKPGNVMLTRTGAKLMDFGLARVHGPGTTGEAVSQTPTVNQPLTAEGTLLGTFQYMAPEQLEGRESDARSDLWALGCVLYEMATGARAFEGKSQASLIAAIMTGEPRPVSELRPVTPPALERVIQQCLQKDPEARVQSARDLEFLLELVPGSGTHPAAEAGARSGRGAGRRVAPWVALAAAAALGIAGFAAGRLSAPAAPTGAIRVSTLSQGTRDGEPAVSPDGRLVAFRSVRGEGQGLWLMDLVTRSEVKLTHGLDQLPRFTPDGGTIVFTRTRDGRQSLWRIPAIGGTERPLLDDAFDADPSPDGKRLAFVTGVAESSGVRARLMVSNADGTGAREIYSLAASVIGTPRWSPDGGRISISIGGNQNSPNRIEVVEVASGKARAYPPPRQSTLSSTAWDGTGRGLIVAEGQGVTAVQRGAPAQLLRLDLGSGRYRPIGWLENFPLFVDLLPDGGLVMSSAFVRQNLKEAAIGARTLSEARVLTSGMARDRQPVYSPDGKSVLFSTNRGSSLDLWEVSVETGAMHRITDDPADDWDPAYTPDGEGIVWCSGRSGALEIWIARRDGSAPRQISRDSLDAENPSIAPSQDWVVYSSAHPAKSGLWRVPASGEAGERVLAAGTLIPDLSPDGRLVSVLTSVGSADSRLDVFDLERRRLLPNPVRVQVSPGPIQMGRSRFSPDGASVHYIGTRTDGQPVLLRRPVEAWRGAPARVDTLFPGSSETIETFHFSRDGRRVVVSVVDWLSSLTIAERMPGIVPPRRKR